MANAVKKIDDRAEDDFEAILGAAVTWKHIDDGKGRGVFAARDIKKGEVVETAPVIPVPAANVPEDGPPDGYLLEWDEDIEGEEHAMALGYIMLYNHGVNPNVHCESDFEKYVITVTALRDIRRGEELTWNYNCELWFDPV